MVVARRAADRAAGYAGFGERRCICMRGFVKMAGSEFGEDENGGKKIVSNLHHRILDSILHVAAGNRQETIAMRSAMITRMQREG